MRAVVIGLCLALAADAVACPDDARKFTRDVGLEREIGGRSRTWLEKNFSAGESVCKTADHWVYTSYACSDWRHVLRLWFRDGKVSRVESARVWTGKICSRDVNERCAGERCGRSP